MAMALAVARHTLDCGNKRRKDYERVALWLRNKTRLRSLWPRPKPQRRYTLYDYHAVARASHTDNTAQQLENL